eukprot:TRINITY_DN49753_c0_g1_i2.p1 TRINITY_DN49753_c0_g1~~TRINITY_DN49753_c0_g1_i2.p1  ORF type:complete len:355 (+),score=72.63 TRINITY_DN49753_c0_g1_i2:37-1101(+)
MGNDQSCCFKYVCCGRDLPSTSMERFLEEADTGDILLFNQKTCTACWKFFSRSEWNHVAIVINTPKNIKFLVEAVQPQVIAWKLEEAMESWLTPGVCRHVAWRKLKGVKRDKKLTNACFKFTLALQYRDFETEWAELVTAFLKQDTQRCCRPKKRAKDKHVVDNPNVHRTSYSSSNMDAGLGESAGEATPHDSIDMLAGIEPGGELEKTTQSLFCSELVAFYYQQAGWMNKDQLPCRFLPKDFADYRNANVQYNLNPGIDLGDMTLVAAPDIMTLPRDVPPESVPSMGTSEVTQNPVASPPSKVVGEVPLTGRAHARGSLEIDPESQNVTHSGGTKPPPNRRQKPDESPAVATI